MPSAVKTTACILALALGTPLMASMPATRAADAARVGSVIAQAEATPSTSLSAVAATRAAQALLQAMTSKNAAALYAGLSVPLRSSTSEAAVQARLNKSPALSGYRIQSISRGVDDTTVEAVALLDGGKREAPLLMVLDDDGKLLAWKWVGQTLPIEQSAIKFVRDLQAKRWVAARYYLDLDFQKEISPQDLERKWSKLVRVLGGMKEIKTALVANEGGEQQLVLVTIAFGKVTDNLFVIFNREGRIINVDFSADLV